MVMPMSSDAPSLAIDRLCDNSREGIIAVACCYVDSTAWGVISDKITRPTKETDCRWIRTDPVRAQSSVKTTERSLVEGGCGSRSYGDTADCHVVTADFYLDPWRQILKKSLNTLSFLSGTTHPGEIDSHLVGKQYTLLI
ncbi:unnamed protein product [Tuber aestivum]|uniref:Uncharacterized protein n=1 Tax=Tuber aestivum TaxID=59557 RepID=A0A292Q2H4_9PEZI|nr:unnamed protein product [Tuber aestivum]